MAQAKAKRCLKPSGKLPACCLRYGDNSKESNIVTEKDITVKTITSSVKDGNTWYYITDTNGKKYKAKITLSDNLPFISNGDKLKVYFLEDKEIIEITDIK